MSARASDRTRGRHPNAVSVSELIERIGPPAPPPPARRPLADDDTQPLPVVEVAPRGKGRVLALAGCGVVAAAMLIALPNLGATDSRANSHPATSGAGPTTPPVAAPSPTQSTTTNIPADTAELTASSQNSSTKGTRRAPSNSHAPGKQDPAKGMDEFFRQLSQALKPIFK